MLAQPRRRKAYLGGRAGQLVREAWEPDRACCRVFSLQDHLPWMHLRMGKHLSNIMNRPAGQSGLSQESEPFIRIAFGKDLCELCP